MSEESTIKKIQIPFTMNETCRSWLTSLSVGRVNRQGRGSVKNCYGCSLGPEKESYL